MYCFNLVPRGCLEQVSGSVVGPETELSSGRTTKILLCGEFYNFFFSPAEIVGSNPTGGMDICLL